MFSIVIYRLERGQGLVEYALILVLIAIAVIVGLAAFGGGVQGLFNSITTDIAAIT